LTNGDQALRLLLKKNLPRIFKIVDGGLAYNAIAQDTMPIALGC
jgi:hypothetical protein